MKTGLLPFAYKGGHALVIDFSKFDAKARPTLVLRNLDGTAIQTLGYWTVLLVK